MFKKVSKLYLQADTCKYDSNIVLKLLFFVLLFSSGNSLFAEGSKDFRNYPGTRMWLDTRDDQQLKVFAQEGEFLNIGASHLAKAGGFIQVFRPDGTLHVTYDGLGNNPNEAIIFDSTQEDAGPTGGGTTNGAGYEPGVIQVATGQSGIWTVVMDFPFYVSSFFTNIQNSDPWTRAVNQPNFGRAILAWDVTVTENGAGNDGGVAKEGRLFSNEFISLIQSNGNSTSPTLFVLTRDGFIYQVDIDNADPYRFPISSSGTGFVNSSFLNQDQSQEKANVIRSDDPASWTTDQVYLYEPQAQDTATFLINNKIFFNFPDTLMPNFSQTTDVFRSNPHTTWLKPELPELDVDFSGAGVESDTSGLDGCAISAIGYGEGGYFVFTSSRDGRGSLQLDLNENGIFDEPIDISIPFVMTEGPNAIFWNGNNGLGEPVPVGEYQVDYALIVRAGEVHITLADVENNTGGVSFTLLNGFVGNNPNAFYYDHSNVGGGVSGVGGVPGYPQPTTESYTYDSNFGNNKLLDYWAYVNFDGTLAGTLVIGVIPECGPFVVNDNDEDGILDGEDIDDDNDGIPDVLEYCNGAFDFSCLPNGLDPSHDEDNDGVLNLFDSNDTAVNNPCVDADANGVCDELLAIFDTDGDGVPDHFDLDSDNDGILDLVEAGHTALDADGNGVIDGPNEDFGLNGLYNDLATDPDDLAATSNYTPWDFDNDGVPDHNDLDSDNDGINDVVEAMWYTGDTDGDGVIDDNGAPASVGATGLVTLINPSATGVGVPYPQDWDEDGIPDWHDLDSDNDGINDVAEAGFADPDNDGIIGTGNPEINLDGQATVGQNGNPLFVTSFPQDWDEDGIPDWHDLDSDNDGINDVAEAGFIDPDNNGFVGVGIPLVNENGQAIEDGNNNPIATTSNPLDWDEDGVPDWHDLDSDNDGINDVAEAGFSDPDDEGIVGVGIPVINEFGQAIEDENGNPIMVTSFPQDWDEDGVPDFHDLDSDNDGINDVEEAGFSDPDNDGIIGEGTPIVNENGQTTEDENGNTVDTTSNPNDWDSDGIPNYHDLDTDNDGINDVEEAGFDDPDNDGIVGTGEPVVNNDGQAPGDTSNPLDTDGDGIPDYQDLDSDNDNINDVEEAGFDDPDNDGVVGTGSPIVNEDGQSPVNNTSNPTDTDEDGMPDYQDLDSDDDGISDVIEAGFEDPDNDGVVGTGDPVVGDFGQPNGSTSEPTDSDDDGTPDYQEVDSDDDGLLDEDECPDDNTCQDWDMDGIPDFQDWDSDNDGIDDGYECHWNGIVNPCPDTDMDGFANGCDLDSDGDGIPDAEECPDGAICPDADGNGIPEVYEYTCNESSLIPNLVNPVGGGEYCEGAIINLSAESTVDFGENLSYVWTGPDGINFPTQSSGSIGPFILNVGPANSATIGTYTLVVYSPQGCGSDQGSTFTIEVGLGDIVGTTPLITTADTEICDGDQLILNATSVAGNDIVYTWSFSGTIITEYTTSVAQLVIDPFTMANVGDYTVQIAVDGCESIVSDPISINIATVPALSNMNGSGEYCEGDNIILSALNDYSGTEAIIYEITDPNGVATLVAPDAGNNFIYNLGTANSALSGGYTVIAQTSNGCTSDAINYNVEVIANPVTPILLASDNIICDGETLTLSTSDYGNNATYSWYCNGDLVATTPVPTVDIANTTDCTYTVSVSVNGCDSDQSNGIEVTIGDTLTLSNQSGGGNYCEGDNITLSADMSNSGTSSLACTLTSPSGNTTSLVLLANQNLFIDLVGATPDMSGTWTVICESPTGCPSNELSFVVNVGAQPVTPTIDSNDAIICDNATLELTTSNYTGNVIYTWCLDTEVIATTTVPSLELSAPVAGDYTVSVTVNGCDSEKSAPLGVLTDVAPLLTDLTGSGLYCEGDIISFEANIDYPNAGNVTIVITDPNNMTTTQVVGPNDNFEYTFGPATTDMSGMYSVSLESDNGCISDANLYNVSVQAIPVTPTILLSAAALCPGEELLLFTADYGANATYIWNGPGLSNAESPINTFTVANPLAGDYSVTVIVNGCISSTSNPVTFSISDGIVLEMISGAEFALCEGEDLALSAMNTNGGTEDTNYTWVLPNGTEVVGMAPLAGPFSINLNDVEASGSGIYCLTVHGELGCPDVTSCVDVTINAKPEPPVLDIDDDKLCEGGLLELNASQYNGEVSYEWFFNGVSITTTDEPTFFIEPVSAADDGEYSVIVTVNGCESEASNIQDLIVMVSDNMEISNSTNAEDPACEGESINLALTAVSGATYEWFGPNQFTANIPNPTILDVSAIDAGEYYVVITTEFCTITTQPTEVFIADEQVEAMDDSFVIGQDESLDGANIILNDEVSGAVNMTIISDPSNGEASIVNGTLNYTPNEGYFGSDELQYEICSLICPDVCSIATVSIQIVEPEAIIPCDAPNIITPNNDGINDTFSLLCLDTDDYPAANVKIFNRWGDKIFEEDGYKNSWSGEYKGRQTPTGTYYYIVQLAPNSEECIQGYFTLTR